MSNILSKKMGFWEVLKFTGPTIIMLVFMSLYTMVDGVFVSNYIGENALSAVNMVFPISCLIMAFAIMLSSGGSAIIASKMGEGKSEEAKSVFSMLVAVGIGIGISMGIVVLIFIKPIINLLGASPLLFDFCHDYLSVITIFAPFAVLQMLFQFFFVTAGKPKLGLFVTILGGVANIILDYLFIAVFNMGISGAALATGIGYCIPAICGLVYFTVNKKGTLHFTRFKLDSKILLNTCLNGSSEMVTNLATAVTTFLFNIIMIKYLGESGVAAITIVLYSQFLLTAVFLGFSSGIAPVLSYNYGEENREELKKLVKICVLFIVLSSILIFGFSIAFSPKIVGIFVNVDSNVFSLAINGFLLFAISYLFTGFNIFASSLFTALSNGAVSAFISFVRTFVFLVAGILFLPLVLGANGVWLAVPFAELLTLAISIFYVSKLKKHYLVQ